MTSAKPRLDPLANLVIPEFQNFITQPRNETCVKIDSTRLMVEILGGLGEGAQAEFEQSDRFSKMLIEGEYVLVFRYRREADGSYRPACSIGFDVTESGGVHVKQMQGSSDKRVSFRFSSSFKTQEYLLKLLEESFIRKGIPVTVEHFPTGLEGAADVHQASLKYRNLSQSVTMLNEKYGVSTKAKSHLAKAA